MGKAATIVAALLCVLLYLLPHSANAVRYGKLEKGKAETVEITVEVSTAASGHSQRAGGAKHHEGSSGGVDQEASIHFVADGM